MENKNYVGTYFTKTENDFKGFFTVNKQEGESKIDEYEKKLKELTAQIDEMEGKLANEYSKKYSQKYVKPSKPVYLYYIDRNNNKHYYATNGQGVDESHAKDSYLYKLETKSGEVDVLGGFCYELASIVIKCYKYTIASDNNTVKLKLIQEELYDFLGDRTLDSRSLALSGRHNYNLLRNLDGDEFISTLYGVPVELKMNLDWHHSRKYYNASYETILKTAPKEVMQQLLCMDTKENLANYKLMGISKELYNTAIDKGVIAEVFALKDFIKANDIFNKTENEWLEMIEKCKTWQEELAFYDIETSRGYGWYSSSVPETCRALVTFADIYKETSSIRMYYSFGKFINYAIDGCINQGYSSIRNFADELKDYCRMCDAYKVKPIMFSNSLKISHDVMSRNLKVVVSPEDEAIFKSCYESFKPFKKEGFSVIAPSCSADLKSEANQMNSCIAGRLKKIIDKQTLIYFMRKNDELAKSLVSLEVINGVLVEAKQCHNDPITKEQEEFLKAFCEDRGFVYNA